MARIDDLVAEVADKELRAELAEALSRLRRNRRFGIVFEEHVPETTALPTFPLREGVLVQKRASLGGETYRVEKLLSRGQVRISTDGVEETIPSRDVAVVKRFGDPIYPALAPVGEAVVRDSDKPYHVVVNGENYNALQTLIYLHEGEVDCVYLDPPYNTGARDWKYNNRYVDDADSWHHSKWLSFMAKRLKLTKRLLSRTGVLIVTIDEHEVHHLGMLLERIFPDYDRHMVTIVHNPKGTYKKNFARVDEYAFFCVPRNDRELINALPRGMFDQATTPEDMAQLTLDDEEEAPEDLYLRRRGQESGYRHQRPNQFYALLVDEESRRVVGMGPPLAKDGPYEVSRDGTVVTVYPLDSKNEERVWRYGRETMEGLIAAGEIVVTGYSKRTGQGWVLQHRRPMNPDKRLKTVWWEKRHDAGTHGSDLLSNLLGSTGQFPFPKSVYAVRDCLNAVVRDRPSALIVDCFAGSGTTMHATCMLNAEDGGRRRSILVTNNEVSEQQAVQLAKKGLYPGDQEYEAQGIFWSVTQPRCTAVVKGVRADGTPLPGEYLWSGRRSIGRGFSENVEFFELQYLDPDDVDLGRQFDAILPLLWMAAGSQGPRPARKKGDVSWFLPDENNFAVLLDDSKFDAFLAAITTRENVSCVWIVTDSRAGFTEMKAKLGDRVRVGMLYEEYLRTFRINTVEDE